ncbi:MAG: hypothetical protein ACOC34_01625, partial [Thermotogota bacterium]
LVLKTPGNKESESITNKTRFLICIAVVIVVLSVFAKKIEMNGFRYDDNLIGLEPIFTQKVKITTVDKDASGQVFLNIADGSRVRFLGIEFLYPDEAIDFLKKNMTDTMVYLSFEGKEEDNAGFKNAYVWSDEIYEYNNVSTLWNAVLIINGFAQPLDFDYTYKEIFFALESEELEVIKTEVEDVKTTREIQQTINDRIPPGFETIKWNMKKPEVWYRMNKQLIEERDNKLVYITNLYGESCLLTFLFDDESAIKSVSYVFSFVEINHAKDTFEKFVKNLNKIFGEDALMELKAFQTQDNKISEAHARWGGQSAKVELLMGTLSRNVHAMRLSFVRVEP